MSKDKKDKIDKINFWILIPIIIICFLVIFAWLTKAWYFPNIFDIDILYSKNEYSNNRTNINEMTPSGGFDKPVIYLYPETKTNILVKLDYKWKIIADYPEYNYEIQWWDIIADSNSTITNKADNKEYNYLFWEWKSRENINWNLSKWFMVKGSESRSFLQEILPKIWLTPKEYNEFIVYWYPIMQKNKYNLIHFAEKQYTNIAQLDITPKPDSMLRVFMVIKPLENKIKIEKQEIKTFNRKWFSVVEWGWTLLN